MNSESYKKLGSAAASDLESKFNALKEHAERAITQRLEMLSEEGKVLELSDDEMRMLRSYRSFQSRSQPGSVFSWQTPCSSGITMPTEVSIIIDPQDKSEPSTP